MKTNPLYTLTLTALLLTLSGCASQKSPATKKIEPSLEIPSVTQKKSETNQACIDIIKDSEGVRLNAYKGPGGHWLIGYGHKAGVKQGMTINAPQAEVLLKADLLKIENQMHKLVKVPVNNNQFSALVCLGYNIGMGNLYKSTLLRLLNKADYTGASEQFSVWRKAAGKVNAHLVQRRAKEKSLFDR